MPCVWATPRWSGCGESNLEVSEHLRTGGPRTPGWNRTSGLDARNVALCPLSYGGVQITAWTGGESNPARQACKARLCTSTQPGWYAERTAGIEPASSVWKTDMSTSFTRSAQQPMRGSNPLCLIEGQAAYP